MNNVDKLFHFDPYQCRTYKKSPCAYYPAVQDVGNIAVALHTAHLTIQ